jgi:hypothetical protein
MINCMDRYDHRMHIRSHVEQEKIIRSVYRCKRIDVCMGVQCDSQLCHELL